MLDFAAAVRSAATDDPDLRRIEITDDWMQGRAVFGGLVAAAGLEALKARIDAERQPRAVHAAFFGPVGAGPVTIRTRIMRAGRSTTHARAELEQDGTPRAQITAAFGAARPSDLIVEPAPMPRMAPPDDGPAMPYIEGLMPRFTRGFDYRFASKDLPFSNSDTARIDGWICHRGPASSPHASVLALLDAWPAPILTMARMPIPASTVSWSTTFAEVPETVEPGRWWGFTADAQWSADGHVAMRGALYAPDGRLAAIEEQLVVVFDRRTPTKT